MEIRNIISLQYNFAGIVSITESKVDQLHDLYQFCKLTITIFESNNRTGTFITGKKKKPFKK